MRIAIYSRKSKWTGKGDSVENQLAMCREYLTHVLHIPEDALILEYEDEGFSGKNTNRPGFLKMLEDMDKEHFDYLVCYKLDRLGRNLLDLTTLMEKLEREDTSFVSIKERFDTTTPIGKAMLYFSGVLAQMEREQIGERVRDNMQMLARDGRWLGGNTPYGFRAVRREGDRKAGRKSHSILEPIGEELENVRQMFQLYLQSESLTEVIRELDKRSIRTRNNSGYKLYSLRDILKNPVYCRCEAESVEFFRSLGCFVCLKEGDENMGRGFMAYSKTSSKKYKTQSSEYASWILAAGVHPGLIPAEDFIRVQKLLMDNQKGRKGRLKVRNRYSLLAGRLVCQCGSPMRAKLYPLSGDVRQEEREFFYICRAKEQEGRGKCRQTNLNGRQLDDAIWEVVLSRLDGEEMDLSNANFMKKQEVIKEYLEEIRITKEGLKIYGTCFFHSITIPFPLPLGPTIARNSPLFRERHMLSNTFVSPDRL